jgi:hypothetical protein
MTCTRSFACTAALVACIALQPLAAMAQAPADDALNAIVGSWEISNADHDQSCMLTLKADPAPGGARKLEFDKAGCAAKFPPLKEVTAWNLTGDSNVRLTDAKGKIIYDFTEVENGMYESLRAGQPLTFLQSAAAAAEAVRTVEEMTGEWSVVRGGGDPICMLTLSNAPASPGELALQVKPGCDPAVVRFGPLTWSMDHGELVLKSARGQIWRFEDNNGVWQRVPQDPDQILLSKR